MSSVTPSSSVASPSEESPSLELAIVQMDFQLGDLAGNCGRMLARLDEAADHGAQLIVFPECAISGYCTDSLEETRTLAQPVRGEAYTRLQAACVRRGVHAVYGQLEVDPAEEARGPDFPVYNTAVAIGPEGIVATYRKTHLPFIGADRFTSYGAGPLTVFEINGVRIGVLICYDGGFPEPSRVLALAGADLILLPTNWPPTANVFAAHACQIRSMENTVFFASSSRIGTERGVRFIGQSRICSPLGNEMTAADDQMETILYAKIDSRHARNKHLIRTAGESEINRVADRRPELYASLVEPSTLPRAGGRSHP
jgi:predicted amidohydrolase